jgi:hypothetical protein
MFKRTLVMLVFLSNIHIFSVRGQDVNPTSDFASASLLLVDDHTIRSWNSTNNQISEVSTLGNPISGQNPFISSQRPSNILAAAVSHSGNMLYMTRGVPVSPEDPSTLRSVERLSLINGASEILYQDQNIIGMVVSPNEQYIAILYYVGEFGFSEKHVCILQLSHGLCSDVPLSLGIGPVEWLDNDTLVVIGHNPRSLYQVNALTSQASLLMGFDGWYIYSFGVIPNSSSIMVYMSRYNAAENNVTNRMAIYDLASQAVAEFPLDSRFQSPDFGGGTGAITFSNSGRHFFVQGDYAPNVVVEFASGHIVHEFPGPLIQSAWLAGNEQIVVQTDVESENSSFTTVLFDADTTQTTSLAFGNEVVRFVAP